MLCLASHPSFKLGFNKPLNTLFLHYQAMSSKLMLRGTSAAHSQAHFRFGFFVAAALAPDALSCYGASLVAGLAAGRFVPASVPLFPLVALVSVALIGPLRPSFDPAAALFSLLLERAALLSVVVFFSAVAFLALPPLLPTEVEAFFGLDALIVLAAEAFALLASFFGGATVVFDFLGGDLDTDLPAAALALAGAALCTVLADFGGDTLVLAFARTGDAFLGGDTLALLGLDSFGAVYFYVPGIFFLISGFLAVADR